MRIAVFAAFLFVCWMFPDSLRAHGDVDDRIEQVTGQIRLQPANAALYFKRGELYRVSEHWIAARLDYDRAERLDPGLVLVDLARGKLFLASGQPQPALRAVDRYFARGSESSDARALRARILVKLRRGGEAAAEFTRAIAESSEPSPDFYIERALALAGEGPLQIGEALGGLEEGVQRLGPLVTLELPAIDLELRKKNYDGALARLDRLSAQSPRQEEWLTRRGEILKQAGRAAEARQAFADALAAVELLSPRLRSTAATQDLEARLRAALQENGR